MVNTSNELPAGRGLVGYYDPQLTSGARELVQARVRITAPVTLAQLRRVAVSMVVSDDTTHRVEASGQGLLQ